MRRKDREIINKEQIWRIMQRCGVCRVAFHDAEYPYIVPLNFGIGKGNRSRSISIARRRGKSWI